MVRQSFKSVHVKENLRFDIHPINYIFINIFALFILSIACFSFFFVILNRNFVSNVDK